MLETPHVVVAAAIATKVTNPALALPLALGSHFILELVPHWNPHINTEMKKFGKLTDASKKVITADFVLSLVLGFYIASFSLPNTTRFFIVIAACFVGVLPDLIEAPYYLTGKRTDFILNKWIPFKKSIQADASKIPGLVTQALIIAAGFLWILN